MSVSDPFPAELLTNIRALPDDVLAAFLLEVACKGFPTAWLILGWINGQRNVALAADRRAEEVARLAAWLRDGARSQVSIGYAEAIRRSQAETPATEPPKEPDAESGAA